LFGYGCRQAARMLGLPESQVRAFAREGLLAGHRGPRGELRFNFQDLLLLRVARDLRRAHLSLPRVKSALRGLRTQLPVGRSLAAVRITAEGDRVVVRDGSRAWQPESGQALLDFEVSEVAAEVSPILKEAVKGDRQDAEEFYAWGCDLEDGAPEQARLAYARALALDPAHYGAHLNLGRLMHEAGDLEMAERHYRRALEARPGEALPLFNLGVALEDEGRAEEALSAYEACLTADPRHEDAHHNAGRLCERLGLRARALRHLGAARRLKDRAR